MLGQRGRAGLDRPGPGALGRQIDLLPAQRLQLGHRPLRNDSVVAAQELARHGQAVNPVQTGRLAHKPVLGHAHPADQDRAPIRRNEALRSIKLETIIPTYEGVAIKHRRLHHARARRHRQIPGVVAHPVRPGLLANTLRAARHVLAAIQFDAVGALPHVTQFLGAGHGSLELPRQPVVRAVYQHHAHVLARASAQQHVQAAVLVPDLGVAYVAAAVVGVVAVAKEDLLGAHVKAVGRLDQDLVGLATLVDEVVVARLFDVAGVVKAQQIAAVRGRAGHHQGATRVRAVCVVGAVLGDRHAVVLPVDQVAAGVVAPAARRVGLGPSGAPLVEHVVEAAKVAQAVGVVQPACGGRHQVKAHSPGIGGHGRVLSVCGKAGALGAPAG